MTDGVCLSKASEELFGETEVTRETVGDTSVKFESKPGGNE